MPRIPDLGNTRINVNAVDVGPSPSAQAAGAIGNALASVGGQLQGFGERLMVQRAEAESQEFMSKSKMDFISDRSKKEQELQKQFSQDPTGYAKELDTWSKDWHDQKKEAAPSFFAANNYKRFAVGEKLETSVKATAWEGQQKTVNYKRQLETDIDVFVNDSLKNPDPSKTAEGLQAIFERVNSQENMLYPTEEANRIKDYAGKRAVDSLMTGYYNQGTSASYAQGKRIAEGKDPSTAQILKMAGNPEDIAHWQAKFSAKLEGEKTKQDTLYSMKLQDTITKLNSGESVNPASLESLQNSIGSLPPEKQPYIRDTLEGYKRLNQNLQTLATRPISEAAQMLDARVYPETDDAFNAGSRSQVNEAYRKGARRLMEMRVNENATFQTHPIFGSPELINLKKQAATGDADAVEEYVTKMEVAMKAEGVTGTVFTKDTLSSMKNVLLNTTPEASIQRGNDLVSKIGIGVMGEIAQVDQKFAPHAVAFIMPDKEKQMEAMEILRSDTSRSSKKIPVEKFSRKTMEVLSTFSGFGDTAWVNNGMLDMANKAYNKYLLEGESQSSAQNKALSLINDAFEPAAYGKSRVIVPQNQAAAGGRTLQEVEDFMAGSKYIINREEIKAPEGFAAKMGMTPGSPEEETFYLQELRKSHAWINSPTMDSVLLTRLVEREGKMIHERVEDKNGNPYEVKFRDMASASLKAESNKKFNPNQIVNKRSTGDF